MMIKLLEDKRKAIAQLCRSYGVDRLEVFGSASDGTFKPNSSDVDFLVEFLPGQNLGPWLAHYFNFKEALEKILGTAVDLVMTDSPAMENSYFLEEANRTRRLIFAA